jgi:hypothetical protein
VYSLVLPQMGLANMLEPSASADVGAMAPARFNGSPGPNAAEPLRSRGRSMSGGA